MSPLNTAIEIGRSALRTQQIGLSVTGNNIANVNTPGYARQHANLASSSVVINGLGSGAQVAAVTRIRDTLLDGQSRYESGVLGRLEAMERAMSTVESIFTEMSGSSTTEAGAVFNQSSGAQLSGAFSRFFNAFQDLANNPESQAGRAVVREEGVFLAEQFHRLQDKLSALRTDLDKDYRDAVVEMNRLTEQIAHINVRILSEKSRPNEVTGNLDDERDRLIDELASLANINVREQTDGTVTVTIQNGGLLVNRGASTELSTRSAVRDGASVSDLTIASTGEIITPSEGKLKGLAEARDEKITTFQSSLDTLAETFVAQVNAIHAGGFGLDGSSGTVFFNSAGTTAREISVSDAILSDLNKIAASDSATSPGGGSNALALSDLRLEKILGGGTQTVEEFYGDLVGQVGAEAKGVFTDTEGQRLVMEQVVNRRENVRGVSINEEATDLILFQRAYQAAARLVTIVDEMMQSVLTM